MVVLVGLGAVVAVVCWQDVRRVTAMSAAVQVWSLGSISGVEFVATLVEQGSRLGVAEFTVEVAADDVSGNGVSERVAGGT